MSQLTALSLSIAVLGGVWTYLSLDVLGGAVVVWGGFIAWGCYFAAGADDAALKKTIAGMVYGAVLAGVALALLGADPLGLGGLADEVYVAVTVFALVIVAGQTLLSAVPANVYGYAATAGLALSTNNMNVTAMDTTNPVVVIAISAVLGAVFGMLSNKLAGALGK